MNKRTIKYYVGTTVRIKNKNECQKAALCISPVLKAAGLIDLDPQTLFDEINSNVKTSNVPDDDGGSGGVDGLLVVDSVIIGEAVFCRVLYMHESAWVPQSQLVIGLRYE